MKIFIVVLFFDFLVFSSATNTLKNRSQRAADHLNYCEKQHSSKYYHYPPFECEDIPWHFYPVDDETISRFEYSIITIMCFITVFDVFFKIMGIIAEIYPNFPFRGRDITFIKAFLMRLPS